MTSPWIVTTNTDRITLDATRHGELTFTVTNATGATDQVVFEAVPGEGVDRSAFTVDSPGRRIAGGASAAFLLNIALGPQAAPGHYEVYGQAYSAHLAPEETLGRSGRVVFDLAAEPKKKKFPWWIVAVAALVVVVLVVVLTVALHGRGAKSTPPPAAAPSTAVVPGLTGQTRVAATSAVKAAGLRLGTVRLRNAPDQKDAVVDQSPAGSTAVARGTAVDLIVGVDLSALPRPVGKAPAGGITGPTAVAFSWTPAPDVNHYLLVLQRQYCGLVKNGGDGPLVRRCFFTEVLRQQVAGTSLTTDLPPVPPQPGTSTYNGNFQFQVADVDDFGTPGPAGAFTAFSIPA